MGLLQAYNSILSEVFELILGFISSMFVHFCKYIYHTITEAILTSFGCWVKHANLKDLKGEIFLNNPHMDFIYSNIIEVTHMTCQPSSVRCKYRELKTNTAANEATINKRHAMHFFSTVPYCLCDFTYHIQVGCDLGEQKCLSWNVLFLTYRHTVGPCVWYVYIKHPRTPVSAPLISPAATMALQAHRDDKGS